MSSILVSGDIKAPIDCKLIYKSKIKDGLNKYITAFTIWKPIAPKGYKSLGYIIDTKPYKKKPIKPSLDRIACIPEECCIKMEKNSKKMD